MHRSKTGMVTAVPGRFQSQASAWHRRGVATTYKLHDRYLSNRRARSLYTSNRPSLDGTQRRIVKELHESGFSLLPFTELFPEEVWSVVAGEGAEFVAATEAGLEGEGAEVRKRAGKDFLVRKYDMGGVVTLGNPWLVACTSRLLLDVANEYLQIWAKLEYLDFWYSLPVGQDAERKASQIWHRDYDDSHLLKAFLYLSDVDEHAGPFEYVPESHPEGQYAGVHPWGPMATGRVSDSELAKYVPADGVRTFTAPRGTLILCNTSGLHRGGFAETTPRVLATATYCSPASLASLTQRSFALAPGSDTSGLDPVVQFALS